MSTQEIATPAPVVVAAFAGYVCGVDPSTGRVLWEREVRGHTPRIVVTDTQVFVASKKLLCLAYPSGEIIWERDVSTVRGASLILSDGRLFSGSNGEVVCYSARDGAVLWTNKFAGKGSDVVALGTPSNTMQADFDT